MISEVQGEVQGLMKSDDVMLSRFDVVETGIEAYEESTHNQKAAVEKAEEDTATGQCCQHKN